MDGSVAQHGLAETGYFNFFAFHQHPPLGKILDSSSILGPILPACWGNQVLWALWIPVLSLIFSYEGAFHPNFTTKSLKGIISADGSSHTPGITSYQNDGPIYRSIDWSMAMEDIAFWNTLQGTSWWSQRLFLLPTTILSCPAVVQTPGPLIAEVPPVESDCKMFFTCVWSRSDINTIINLTDR